MVETFTDFAEAHASAERSGLSVGGTFRTGVPLYFLHDPTMSDSELHDLAFEAVNGRQMSPDERRLDALARTQVPEAFAP